MQSSKWVEVRLSGSGKMALLIGVWGTLDQRLHVGWSCVSLSLVRGVELRGDGFWTLVLFLLSLFLSLSLCESLKSFEGKMRV